MRIAFLNVTSQIGGSEVVLLQIMQHLSAVFPSWALHLLVPARGLLAERAAAHGVQVTVLPMPAALVRVGEAGARRRRARMAARLLRVAIDLPAYERALSETLHGIGPDVIHSNGIKTHVVASRVAGASGRLVWHIHDYVGRRPITRTVLRRYAGRCAAIVANSESVAQDVRSALRPPVAVRTIYNGVDLERFSPEGAECNLDALAAMTAAAPGTVRVGLVGTFARWKGHETFLRAIAALPADVPVRAYVIGAAIYDTAGSQHSETSLRRLASDLDIGSRVAFTGFVPAVADAMRALDIVVHPSVAPEPFGLAVVEAMACGRAVITTATGGAAELVEDGVDAMTHPPGDHVALAGAIAALAGDSLLRGRLGKAARETARRRFDARRCGDEFADVYTAAAKGRTPA